MRKINPGACDLIIFVSSMKHQLKISLKFLSSNDASLKLHVSYENTDSQKGITHLKVD